MSLLNDDELNSLLERARSKPPQPSPNLALRVLRAYQTEVAGPLRWRQFSPRSVSVPWPLGVLTAVLLILLGALGDYSLRHSSVSKRAAGEGSVRERVVHDCAGGQEGPSPSPEIITFQEFQPVGEIRPRVVRETRDGR